MSRRWFFNFALVLLVASSVRAQQSKGTSELLKKSGSPGVLDDGAAGLSKPGATAPSKTAGDKTEQKAPTEITAAQEASFDEKSHKAIFIGDVHVNDPQFKLVCDKLTAFLKKGGANSAKASPSPTADAKSPAGHDGSGGLEKAIAEGHVVITQDKPNPDGGEPTHYIGKSERADYDAKTGDVILTGWPQVQSGINNQVSTEQSTVMILNRDGRMLTKGHSKTLIQDESETDKKKTPQAQ